MAHEPFPAAGNEVVLTNGTSNNVSIGQGNDFGSFITITGPTGGTFRITGFDISGIDVDHQDGRRLVVAFNCDGTLELSENDNLSASANQLSLGMDFIGSGSTIYSHDVWPGYTVEFVYNAFMGFWNVLTPMVAF